MARLEDLQQGAHVRGLDRSGVATVEAVSWVGEQAVKVIYRSPSGALKDRLVYRDDEPTLALVAPTRQWSFDGDGDLLRLVSEANRIQLAWLFDPFVAVSSSLIRPLPHQISAVYEEMLPRQPLRFLLADDPGAGKTISAGLLIRELMVRGDLERCLVIAPGSLTEQWQDELSEKFGLNFEILTREMLQASRTSNPFGERHLLIARMDQLSRNDEVQERLLAAPEWDLIVCDEAHRMAGSYMSGEVKLTKRYHLGQAVGGHCRNFLLMTATPHNGKQEDFELFLALLDGDRFEGRHREGVHSTDPSGLMRRLIKEDLFTFEGTKLFPERRSYTVQYALTDLEAQLYRAVTDYVREQMNRADDLVADENGQRRRVSVGFALMTLQRRLASSSEAIHRSLERRRERLEARLRDERLLARGGGLSTGPTLSAEADPDEVDGESFDDIYDEAPQNEREAAEQSLVDNATAARTIEELEVEIDILKDLENLSKRVLASGLDAKWQQLLSILDDPLMVDPDGHRRKLVIFSEFRDTLSYLGRQIRTRLGRHEAVVEIHGSVNRDERRKVVQGFMNDPEVLVLIANDAAGEGVNLQRAHLMVNYDLPWNPNRLEQRFGRIHRIGQEEVCHLWNLVAKDTKEGDVYCKLLKKIEAEAEALDGKVFDVLGQLFDQRALRELLMEAIRYGDDPARKAELSARQEGAVDHARIRSILEMRALVHDSMDTTRVRMMREEMERAQARKLQPGFIEAFFQDAFPRFGGQIHPREAGRFEITHVPAEVRDRDRQSGTGVPVARRYERVTFDKDLVNHPPRAELICPGHPLLDALISLVRERYEEVLKRGAVLIDPNDAGTKPRLLLYLRHTIEDGRERRPGRPSIVSERLLFAEVGEDGRFRDAGAAPYLDYRPATPDEMTALAGQLGSEWLAQPWEQRALGFAAAEIVPGHLQEVKEARIPLLDRTEQQVKQRLQFEINHWDRRAQELREKERAGKKTRLPARVASDRAEKLAERLRNRLAQIERERAITAQAPHVQAGVLVIPGGLLRQLRGDVPVHDDDGVDAEARRRIELLAMQAAMAAERRLGREPRDVSAENRGYDIESKDSRTGHLLFLEVKGRIASANSVTLTANEVRRANNVPDQFRLVVVLVENGVARDPVYVGSNFEFGTPSFNQISSTYSLDSLLQHGGPPA